MNLMKETQPLPRLFPEPWPRCSLFLLSLPKPLRSSVILFVLLLMKSVDRSPEVNALLLKFKAEWYSVVLASCAFETVFSLARYLIIAITFSSAERSG